MMRIRNSGVALSPIVEIGERLTELTLCTGVEYLRLNRGINSVVNIDLSEVVRDMDFNTAEMQTYPPGRGLAGLRRAINEEYFDGASDIDNILIVPGSMNGLDLLNQSVDIEKLYMPEYYWGCFYKQLRIRGVSHMPYRSLAELYDMAGNIAGSGVLICDPGNPLGQKFEDAELMRVIRRLDTEGVVVYFDSPYRRVFMDREDGFYRRLMILPNVVIIESFSKSVGLSGQRIGFIHTSSGELYSELERRTMYANNGVNAFAQTLVLKLLTTEAGRKAVAEFKRATTHDIRLNISYLERRGLLASEFYRDSSPMGIFAIVNKSEQELLDKHIGSVGLDFFTMDEKLKPFAERFSRICVSVPHGKFKEFFDRL